MDHLEANRSRRYSSPRNLHREDRAVVFFLVQRDDVDSFSPCHLDQAYTAQLEAAMQAGVEVLCYTTKLDPDTGQVIWGRKIDFKHNPLPAVTETELAPKGASRKRKASR